MKPKAAFRHITEWDVGGRKKRGRQIIRCGNKVEKDLEAVRVVG